MQFQLKVPLLGFENITSMELEKIDDIFMRLSASNTSDVTFTLINPFALQEYVFDIPNSYLELLEINDKSNILIFNIVIIHQPIEKSTINFAAPLIFNVDNQMMAQLVIDDRADLSIAASIESFMKKADS